MLENVDKKTVADFGDEWHRFDQAELSRVELAALFDQFFHVFPWSNISADSVGFDLGCGSGRWARCMAPKVRTLHCIDPSEAALGVARRNLREFPQCQFHLASVDSMPIPDGSMDFGYALGVLHHIPDTAAGLASCVRKLKAGAPFLLYIYYAFDNRPGWYRTIWRASDCVRRTVIHLPFSIKNAFSVIIAALIYYPLARFSLLAEALGWSVECIPLSWYRRRSFYTMKTDSRDRFGTHLEQRFTATQIRGMMERAGLENIQFSDKTPYWCAVGYKRNE